MERIMGADQDSGPPGAGVATKHAVAPRWLSALEDAFDACEIADGAVLSFHHHLRNGDAAIGAVLDCAARRGLRDLGVAATSLFPVHGGLAEHMRAGVVTRLWTSYMSGPAATAVSRGALDTVAVMQSHGGRARAAAQGELPIDVAFIAAPASDRAGNLTGAVGAAACGPLGYPQTDAAHARRVVALVQEVHDGPLPRCEIAGDRVHFAIARQRIGDPAGIASGSTRIASDPVSLQIAARAAEVVAAAGLLRDGLSLQTGAGGASLAAVSAIGARMRAADVRGSFLSGGVCGAHVALAREGLFREIFDVQCFDQEAVESYRRDPWHHGISAARYASPLDPDPIAARLDVMVLGASEIDRDFNVNVTTAGDGAIIGGPGGHPDTAAGARLSIVTTRLNAGGYAKVVDRVGVVTTPGEDVDVLVTEVGVAVNPRREALEARLRDAGLPLLPIDRMVRLAAERQTRERARPCGRIVARLEDRRGGVRDVVRAVAG
jgi:citrate lyase subunit alpha/citrate CoA-transferase